jgi:L-methionine (R)-S-oxide reductase
MTQLETDWNSWLAQFVSVHRGVAGTVHLLQGEELRLAAALNIPPPVVELTRVIPRGKGMAGLAWERAVPVQTCNLKTDATGDVRPGAKAVGAQAAVALPVLDEQGACRAVVGIAFMDEREIPAPELQRLTAAAAALPR